MTSVPLCAVRTPSPVVAAPEGYGFAMPSAGSRDHCGTCAPVITTGADPRAACTPTEEGNAPEASAAEGMRTAAVTAARLPRSRDARMKETPGGWVIVRFDAG